MLASTPSTYVSTDPRLLEGRDHISEVIMHVDMTSEMM